MSLIRVNGGYTPARFQPGDWVQGVVHSIHPPGKQSGDAWGKHVYDEGQVVEGKIVQWTNNDARQLNQGSVEIALANGDRLWVLAQRVLQTVGEREHPLLSVKTITVHQWVCGCGRFGTADTEVQARNDHSSHQHLA